MKCGNILIQRRTTRRFFKNRNYAKNIIVLKTKNAMKSINKEIYDKLFPIYKKHLQRYKQNPGSGQMSCMWSTNNPPDIIYETDPFYDIEDAFEIIISEDDCMELYDMNIEEAAFKIETILKQK